MSTYRPKKGDRVRVVLEGEVDQVNSDGSARVSTGKYFTFAWVSPSEPVTIEKIEPPVETFGPGTYVHSKAVPRYRYLILEDGYVDLTNNKYEPWSTPFTSDYYVKISPGD